MNQGGLEKHYNEIEALGVLLSEIDKYAQKLTEKKSGCFHHRIEVLIGFYLKEFDNVTALSNKIVNHVNTSSYEKDVKFYLLQLMQLLMFPDKNFMLEIPDSLKVVMREQKEWDFAMVEGLKNHRSSESPTPQQKTKSNGRRGRKPIEIKEAKYYLKKIELPENKDKFLDFLKLEYKNVEHKVFNQLIKVLHDNSYLRAAEPREYREAFEKALGRRPQSKQNFNKQFKEDPDDKIYKIIQQTIADKINDDALV